MGIFATQLQAFETKTTKQAAAAVKKVVLEMFTRIMKRTPVLTGNARVNWEVGVNDIPTGSDIIITGAVEGKDQISDQALLTGLQELESFKVGDTVYIVNNVEYIQILEDGGSNQTPREEGMVKITVREFESIVKEVSAVLG